MSEDYKKIALEDVKKGQRIRIVVKYRSYTATYEGVALRTNTEGGEIDLGEEGDEATVFIGTVAGTSILLLEDAPKPKVVRTEKVTFTHYDDGTTTQTSVDAVPMVIKTMEQFEAHEDCLKQVILKDRTGRYWENRHGVWGLVSLDGSWHFSNKMYVAADNLPMTIVENVGD